jgi:hypothetical protein
MRSWAGADRPHLPVDRALGRAYRLRMAKTKQRKSTIENRVYLFKDLAASLIATTPGLLVSADPDERARALRGLADIAFVSCAIADGADLTPAEVRDRVLSAETSRSKP